MRFMMLLPAPAEVLETAVPHPDMELVGAMHKYNEEMTKAGVLVSTLALKPSSKAKRLTFTNNVLRTIDGPFAETKELIGGFSVMELTGFEEAIELCKPYAAILGGTLEIDVRVVEQDEETT